MHERRDTKGGRKRGSRSRAGGNGEAAARGAGDLRVIVVGASAGGVESLSKLVEGLPPGIPAAVFVVLHVSAGGPSLLPEILSRVGRLPALHARDGLEIAAGHIYVAPPDHHLLIRRGRMALTRGPKENNARPAVDPLFRTAAREYGPRVIGVVLSGGLDDGTLGMMDIKRFGGTTVVQDPEEALFPSMPMSVLENVRVDYKARLAEMPRLLCRLVAEPVVERGDWKEGWRGPDIAEAGSDDLKRQNMNGAPSRFTCPECGGALWELENEKLLRYRCHLGHGFTAETLMEAQSGRLEEAMWTALRALEETAGMRRRMAERARKAGWKVMERNYREQAERAEEHAGLIRAALLKDRGGPVTAEEAAAVEEKAQRAVDPDVKSATLVEGGGGNGGGKKEGGKRPGRKPGRSR